MRVFVILFICRGLEQACLFVQLVQRMYTDDIVCWIVQPMQRGCRQIMFFNSTRVEVIEGTVHISPSFLRIYYQVLYDDIQQIIRQ